MHEVARHAGVSIATVSRVTRGVGQVAPATRQRVLDAVSELRYRPSHLGRALVQKRHGALGMVFPGLAGPYYSGVLQGFEAEAVAARQSVLILCTHMLNQADEQVLEMASRVDGMVILGGTVADATVETLVDEGAAIILLARPAVEGVPTVRVENYKAMLDLTLHMIQVHGYERIAFIGNPAGSPDVTERWHGFLAAHRQSGVEPPDQPVHAVHLQVGGHSAASRLLDGPMVPRAIMCANDEMALGVYGAARARGIRVAEQLAVTGWDNLSVTRIISPSLTTIHQPIRTAGARAAELLLAYIRGELDGAPDIVLPARMVIRGSCGCAYHEAPSPLELAMEEQGDA